MIVACSFNLGMLVGAACAFGGALLGYLVARLVGG